MFSLRRTRRNPVQTNHGHGFQRKISPRTQNYNLFYHPQQRQQNFMAYNDEQRRFGPNEQHNTAQINNNRPSNLRRFFSVRRNNLANRPGPILQQQYNEAIPNLEDARKLVTTTSGNVDNSLLKNIANPTKINSFLNNTQQVLQTAQSIGPIVQQYVPIVKNIPAMWKIYRGLTDSDDNTKKTETTNNRKSEQKLDEKATENRSKANVAKTHSDDRLTEQPSKETVPNNRPVKQRKKSTKSVPKLYI